MSEQQVSVIDPTGLTGQVLEVFPQVAAVMARKGRDRVR
jgi:hypothetical protein